MESELIYLIGESIMLELDEIENIIYPKDYERNALKIETKSGKKYRLILTAIEA